MHVYSQRIFLNSFEIL